MQVVRRASRARRQVLEPFGADARRLRLSGRFQAIQWRSRRLRADWNPCRVFNVVHSTTSSCLKPKPCDGDSADSGQVWVHAARRHGQWSKVRQTAFKALYKPDPTINDRQRRVQNRSEPLSKHRTRTNDAQAFKITDMRNKRSTTSDSASKFGRTSTNQNA